ncbi:MAG: GNAT family N-acetyltransferase [Flavobacteriales bacterium]|nr:GNAT family N-acetyltransferase [Flavobacteriales bacterium]
MRSFRKVLKKDVQNVLEDVSFWNNSFLIISKQRLIALQNNPNAEDDDIVLILAMEEETIIGYMGLFVDYITLNGVTQKMGWITTWWVKYKGTGIGKDLMNEMFDANKGLIAVSQFNSNSGRVFEKSGNYIDIVNTNGYSFALRSNIQELLISKFKLLDKVHFIPNLINSVLSIYSSIKINKFLNSNKNLEFTVEYLKTIDSDSFEFINKHNANHISKKSKEFYNWLLGYYWVLKAPLLEKTNKSKYAFSMYDYDFDISFIKIIKKNEIVGILVLQKRNSKVKVLFAYYNENCVDLVSKVIILNSINQDTREIVCYDIGINNQLNKLSFYTYKTDVQRRSIISKSFGVSNFDNVIVNFGDGDCGFA